MQFNQRMMLAALVLAGGPAPRIRDLPSKVPFRAGRPRHVEGPADGYGWRSAGMPTIRCGRNEPCPCGSGRKFKRCCIGKARPTKPAE